MTLSVPHGLWWWLTWALGGLIIGSFLNVLIHRWPLMLAAEEQQDTPAPLGIARPRSHCPACHHPLPAHHLLPLLSFLWLRGRCGFCQHPISWRYPVVEALNMGWWCWCAAFIPGTVPLSSAAGMMSVLLPDSTLWGPPLAWALWGSALLALAWIDWDSTWLPDGLTQPLVWGGLIAAALQWSGQSLPMALAGAVSGYLSLWLVARLFHLLTGQEGMGEGDIKLLAALGAWLGPGLLIPLVLMASIGGACVGWVLRARGQLREGRYVPFGPFLIGAAMALRLGLDRFLPGV
jgi:leader peptidase (prepilin peptidase)/N-methyltransferase